MQPEKLIWDKAHPKKSHIVKACADGQEKVIQHG